MAKNYDLTGYVPQTNLFGDDETPAIPITRRGGKSILENMSASPAELAKVIGNAVYLQKSPPVKDDEELIDRIDKYFAWCADNGVVPTWEGMGLACGVSRATMWNWTQGIKCGPRRREIIVSAKDTLAAIDAQLAMTGKVTPVMYFFRSKNFYDMRDQQEVVLTPNNPLGDKLSEGEIDQRLIDGFISDDDAEK